MANLRNIIILLLEERLRYVSSEFFVGNLILNIIIGSIFWYNSYFLQHLALKRSYFPISVHYNISKMANFKSPSSTPRGDRTCAHRIFCIKFNFEQLLFEAFFDIIRIFCGILPKTNPYSPFKNVKIIVVTQLIT